MLPVTSSKPCSSAVAAIIESGIPMGCPIRAAIYSPGIVLPRFLSAAAHRVRYDLVHFVGGVTPHTE